MTIETLARANPGAFTSPRRLGETLEQWRQRAVAEASSRWDRLTRIDEAAAERRRLIDNDVAAMDLTELVGA